MKAYKVIYVYMLYSDNFTPTNILTNKEKVYFFEILFYCFNLICINL